MITDAVVRRERLERLRGEMMAHGVVSPELVAALEARGVTRHLVTLHVGAGTFLPVKADVRKREGLSEGDAVTVSLAI